jgi:hypothetical protein
MPRTFRWSPLESAGSGGGLARVSARSYTASGGAECGRQSPSERLGAATRRALHPAVPRRSVTPASVVAAGTLTRAGALRVPVPRQPCYGTGSDGPRGEPLGVGDPRRAQTGDGNATSRVRAARSRGPLRAGRVQPSLVAARCGGRRGRTGHRPSADRSRARPRPKGERRPRPRRSNQTIYGVAAKCKSWVFSSAASVVASCRSLNV